MINKDECIKMILETVPSFQKDWECYVADWARYFDEWGGDDRGFCNDLSEFASFIETNIAYLHDDELRKIFDLIEKFVIDGDDYVSTAATTSFLEDLQHSADANPAIRKVFKYLGKESREFCIAMDKFWNVQTYGLWNEQEIAAGLAPPLPEQNKMEINVNRVACPVCGHLSFYETMFPGSEYICDCGWIDNKDQYYDPDLWCKSNLVSLNQAKINWLKKKLM